MKPTESDTAVAACAAAQGRTQSNTALRVVLLTGADDRSYAIGLATALAERSVHLEFIGSDQVDGPELHGTRFIRFVNLRGDQSSSVSLTRKGMRVLVYYLRLIGYVATSRARVLHILWNNKFEVFDRTLLMLYYRALGRRVVLTAHNVNAARRDGRDSLLNRLTLRIQYRLCSHIFVHTRKMRDELAGEFSVDPQRIEVIPFGINNSTPTTALTQAQARRHLELGLDDRVLLFFGQIAPYKGLEHLVAALPQALAAEPALRLVIAGKVKHGCESYWQPLLERIQRPDLAARVHLRIEHIPDDAVELYFKSADVLVVPYVSIYQSGVPFLAYSFGLPVIATDVGALSEDVIEGSTGLVCPSADPVALAGAITRFFSGPMYRDRDALRDHIRAEANVRYSWQRVARLTEAVYQRAGDDG